MKGGKIWSTFVDYFLLLSAIVGVGVASGKEVMVYFYQFGKNSIFSLLFIGIMYLYLLSVVGYIKDKLDIKSYNAFNQKIFGFAFKFAKVVLIVDFAIAGSGMLAGAGNLMSGFIGGFSFVGVCFVGLMSVPFLRFGTSKIKLVTNIVTPILLALIVINSLANLDVTNVQFPIVKSSQMVAIYFAFLYGANNFVMMMPLLFKAKLKVKGKLMVVITFVAILMLTTLALFTANYQIDMPLLMMSKKVDVGFYYIYFVALAFAICSGFIICAHNLQTLCFKKADWFSAFFVCLVCMIVSQFGYDFIVRYLYIISGAISVFYIILLIIICNFYFFIWHFYQIKYKKWHFISFLFILNFKSIKKYDKILKNRCLP